MTIANYFKEYKKLVKENKDFDKKIKIAYLPSSTQRGAREILTVMCSEIGVKCDTYICEYNQYNQEILNEKSNLYEFKPQIVIFSVDLQTILGDDYFRSFTMPDEKRKELYSKVLQELISIVGILRKNIKCNVILNNFEVPIYSPMGILENKQEFGFAEMVETLNFELRKEFKNVDGVYIFDYNKFLSKIGKENSIDYNQYYIGDIKLDMKFMPELCKEYMAYIKPMTAKTKKCLVLDLDDTLWGGVVGEVGVDGIKLGPSGEGKTYFEFQKYILQLFERGIILAVNSKNNYDDAIEVIKKHPYMILRAENFADLEINWDDKASNIKEISKKLNIGLDSIVFMDDDKLNCEMVKGILPEVKVVNLPEDSSLYVKTLMEIDDFNVLKLTEDDKKRGEMYSQNRQREEFKKASNYDITSYLKGLNMEVHFDVDNTFNIPRVAQLTQKTNQFNVTTKRYFDQDIKEFVMSDEYMVLSIKVKDKFGDNGIVGAAIVEKTEELWNIDTFILSCRVMGRKVENTMLWYIEKEAKEAGVKSIRASYIPTKKNMPVKSFYEDMKFSCLKEENGTKEYEKSLDKFIEKPDFINII